MGSMITAAVAHMSAADRGAEAFAVMSPGRVNLIGDHIDYSGGLVLPMALDRGTSAVVIPRTDRVIRGYSANFPAAGIIAADLDHTDYDSGHGWFSYVLGVVHTALSRGHDLDHGFDLYLDGNIPKGGGLSSSASVEMAAAIALEQMFALGLSPAQWAVLCQEAENRYIGVACGIMDQLSIAVGRAGHAILMDCETLGCEFVPMPTDRCSIMVASTNHPRQLADSAYNDRRLAVEIARKILAERRGEPGLRLVDVTLAEIDAAADELDEAGVTPFARHTVTEQARVVAAAAALRAGDLTGFGELMRQSHESLRDDFQVTGDYLDALVAAAWDTPDVLGARMTGAGFGGCSVNVVAKGAEEPAGAEISRRYERATGIRPDLYVVGPGQGARVVSG